jgi:hypothetical protein
MENEELPPRAGFAFLKKRVYFSIGGSVERRFGELFFEMERIACDENGFGFRRVGLLVKRLGGVRRGSKSLGNARKNRIATGKSPTA